jgi:hypothetical protein
MECRVEDLKKLLDKIQEVTRMKVSRTNYLDVHQYLNKKHKELFGTNLPFGNEYIYRSIRVRVNTAKLEDATFEVIEKNLDAISKVCGYETFLDFILSTQKTIAPVLAACAGTWYSYVRCNSGKEYILRAPVLIYEEKKIMYMKLQGPNRIYTGELSAEGDSLFCLLKSDQVKRIHMVLKTGLVLSPKVLQGVFTGLSAGGDPIAGREILIKQENAFKDLRPDRIQLRKWLDSASEEEHAVAEYFSRDENTIVKAGQSSSFDLDDLRLTTTTGKKRK